MKICGGLNMGLALQNKLSMEPETFNVQVRKYKRENENNVRRTNCRGVKCSLSNPSLVYL
jgi:hypothetical protein